MPTASERGPRPAELPRRQDPHDRVRVPVRDLRLHPAGRLPQRLSDARRQARVRSYLREQRRAAPVLRLSVQPAERQRLQRLARRRHGRDPRRRLRGAGRGAGAAQRGGQRPHGAGPRRARRRGARHISRRCLRSPRASRSCGSRSPRASSPADCPSAAPPTWRSRPCPSRRCTWAWARSPASWRRRGASRSSWGARSSACRCCCG